MKSNFPDRIKKLEPFNGRFEAYKFEAKACDTYFASYPAGTVIEPHSHDTENCGIITRGELFLTTDGKEQRFGVGDWYHVGANQIHSARFDQDTEEIEFWFKESARS